jgi:hypothetical protein
VAGNIATPAVVKSAFAGNIMAALADGCGAVIVDFAVCVVAGAGFAGVFFGGTGSATTVGVAGFSCVLARAGVATADPGFDATSVAGFPAGDGCVATTGAETGAETFARAGGRADELEVIGVAAGGGGMGATVCPGMLAAARAATLAIGFSGSSAGSAGKSGNDASGT